MVKTIEEKETLRIQRDKALSWAKSSYPKMIKRQIEIVLNDMRESEELKFLRDIDGLETLLPIDEAKVLEEEMKSFELYGTTKDVELVSFGKGLQFLPRF
jgi:hypothetical protein